jgi:5'-3' exonuclease
MIVHLIDGTYELFRHFHGRRRWKRGEDPYGGVVGVVNTVLKMIETGATHLGVATDHVIESFRNDLWPAYKSSAGIDAVLLAQFVPLEEALAALGVVVWPMTEMEADDALASAARLASVDERVEKVCIWTPDKDLAQSVRGDLVVQVDRRKGLVLDSDAVRAKLGVEPEAVADYLALVGDTADRYPGVPGIGRRTAVRRVNRYGSIESFPLHILHANRERALLFKQLAKLRDELELFNDVDELEWRGPKEEFSEWAERLGEGSLLERAQHARP